MAKGFKRQFECIVESKEKYIVFSVPIDKELENGKTVKYKIKCINSVGFMARLLPSFAYNVTEGLHNIGKT